MARHFQQAVAGIGGLVMAMLLTGSVQPASAQNPDADETLRLFPLAPRELRQPLTRAENALEEKRFSDAVRELDSILNNPTADDYFLAAEDGADVQLSLRTGAQQLLGGMPAEGRRLYELQSGSEARAMLDEGLEQGDVQKLAEVSRRFFHTKAGYEATLLLGKYHLDHGRPLAAALMLQRVAEYGSAARLYDPELSVLLAGAWNLAGMTDKAQSVLVALKQRQPGAKLTMGDQPVALFTDDKEALPWLEKLIGAGGLGRNLETSQWVMFRGNEMRNASTSGSLPVVNFRWTVPTLNDPQDEQRARQIAKQRIDRGEPIIPALQPLAVKDYVLIRTPDRLLGIDLRTGKRVWVSWWEDDSANKALQQSPQQAANPAAAAREQELRQRLWDDGLFGQLSSDGEQVYIVDDLPPAPAVNYTGPRGVWFGARGVSNQTQYTNRLRALDLRSQGKLKWVVGGTNGEDEPALAGAFFVGPPLPIAGQLYVLAEFNGELRLLCLSAKTGELVWKQQLAILEDAQQIRHDGLRRLASATPSFADGVLVCPTSAGGVVAVDLATRSLRWGQQYPRWDAPQQRFNGGFAVPSNRNQADASRWVDSSVTIAEGKVILTPVESKYLHCLDLLTGEAAWENQERGDMLYVGCVHQQKIVLVGKDDVRSVQLADGKPGWPSISLENETPTGRGYYSDKFYYLPVSGSQLLKIDLDEGKVVSRTKTEIPLGNLICYQDEMISVSPYWVASFYLSEPLRERVEEALKANPDDNWALCSKAELLLQAKQPDEALALLRRAHQLYPQEDRARSLLVKTVLSLLRDNFAAHRELIGEVTPLIDQPAQRRELLQLRARGLYEAGNLWESFEAYQQLSRELGEGNSPALDPSEALEQFERELRVRPDRWMLARLSALFAAADEDVQARMTAAIQTDLNESLQRQTAGALRQFVQRYGFHPLADQARLALAERLLTADQFLEVEVLTLPLRQAADRQTAGHATALVAALYVKAKRPELAANEYRALEANFADVVCREDQTGKQIAEQALAENNLRAQALPRSWPGGKIETKVGDAEANTRFVTFQSNFPVQIQQWEGIPSYALRATFDSQQYSLMLRDGFGRTLVTASLRSNEGGSRRFYPVQNNSLTGRANGHLLMVHLGPELVAVDGLQSERTGSEIVLWRQELMAADIMAQRNFYPQSRQLTNPILGSRLTHYDSTGQVNFSTGPLLAGGITFQRGRQLTCIDPLTGQTLWERSPVEPSAELFGDDELLFVVPSGSDEALVLSALDGKEVGKRKVPKVEQRLATSGRNVLSWKPNMAGYELRLTDLWSPEVELWTAGDVPAGSKGCLIDGSEFALLRPDGLLRVVDLATGRVKFSSQLEPEKNLVQLSVQRSSERYIVMAHEQVTQPTPNMLVQPVNSSVGSTPVVHGRVYSLDATGAKLWPVPAYVTQHYLLREQAAELPLLFFLRNTRGASDARWSTQTLVLDKRTGGIVMEGEVAPNQTQSSDVVADVAQSIVTLKVWFSPGFKTIAFKLTDNPEPPQPPAQTGAQSSLSVGQSRGVVTNVAEAMFRSLNRRVQAALEPARPEGDTDPFAPAGGGGRGANPFGDGPAEQKPVRRVAPPAPAEPAEEDPFR